MAAQHVSSVKLIQSGQLRQLAGYSGLCVTAVLPPLVPGEMTRESARALLRDYTREAEASLSRLGASEAGIKALIEPLEQLAADPATAEGFHWSRAILRSPEVFEEFLLRQPADGGVTVGDRFHLLPLIAEAELPAEFYLLKLSKKYAAIEVVQHDQRAGLRLNPVRLPNLAQTLDEFLALDIPDHDRENRSTGGGSRKILFGTGSERETQHSHLSDFYKHVDRELAKALQPSSGTVVLVGVEEDTALYRSISAYPHLTAESIQRSPDDGVSAHELIRRGLDLMRTATLQHNLKSCELAKERMAPARYSENLDTIAEMAALGRVARLYSPENVRDAKLNGALIDTLLHGGEAHALPAGAPAGAVLRY
jgi:hypothetical protein